ncbi:MAG: hypothetical protein V4501_03035 [Pseudomonadota bacterium]
MHLHLYVYSCGNCGNKFKSPELPGHPYGRFLMRSASGEIAYLAAFEDKVFLEFREMSYKNKVFLKIHELSKSDVLQGIFGKACDPATDNTDFQIGRSPVCPECNTNNKLSWHETNPPELIEMNIKNVTHNLWATLSRNEKEIVLNNAIQSFLKEKKIK